VGARAAQALRAEVPAASLRAVHDWVVRPGHHLLTLTDPAYPARLSNVPDPPLVLYVAGDPALLSRPSLAIVGSRSPSPRGLRDAQSFAQALSEAGLCIVSGLALGIDAAAHRGGLDGGASSIAVVGTGLDCTYPGRNAELARELSKRGAVVSEFPLGTPPLRSNFPRRNRIISGLSLGCLVVEAALHSGSLITAKEAAEQGRDVFAVPGSIHSALAKGCHWLIKQGAKLAESADDVLGELGVGNGSSVTHGPATLDVPDADSARLLQALGGDTLTVDALCERAGLTAEVASAMLLTLELDGYVARLAGGFYQSLR
jgi:DNA processing protein